MATYVGIRRPGEIRQALASCPVLSLLSIFLGPGNHWSRRAYLTGFAVRAGAQDGDGGRGGPRPSRAILRRRWCSRSDRARRPGDWTPSAFAAAPARHQLFGIKAKAVRTDSTWLEPTPLPALARDLDRRSFVLVRIYAQADARPELAQVLIPQAAAPRPLRLSATEFAIRWFGGPVVFSSLMSFAGARARFDFSGVIVTVVRYRWLLGEVLLVFFVLQLFPTVAPRCFPAVMNKFFTDRGLTTVTTFAAGNRAGYQASLDEFPLLECFDGHICQPVPATGVVANPDFLAERKSLLDRGNGAPKRRVPGGIVRREAANESTLMEVA